jgi:ribonuclease J
MHTEAGVYRAAVAAELRIMPVGGLGEVGRNMTVLDWGGERIVVDCGVGFPSTAERDGVVEQLLPDVRVLNTHPIAAVVLTHGHDDHIAALAHLIRQGAPIGRIIGLPFTIELVKAKLAEGVPLPPLVVARPGVPVTTGAFAFEYVRVAHSIPDAAAVAITTPVGVVVMTGDYKLDDTQANPKRRCDRGRLGALGRAGVLAMLGDSTNADEPGRTGSEDSTFDPLHDVVAAAPGRVIVTSFASNIDRIDHAIRAADATNRRVTFIGRSVRRNMAIAGRLGEISPPSRDTAGPRELEALQPRRSMVICTGSQAERNAVLSRASRGDHPHLQLGRTDTVVFASRPVPGNEPDVEAMIAALIARGVKVVTHEDAPIHVSGHARADEVEEMIGLLRPRFLVPVHGEPQMQEAQARIAVARCGLDRNDVVLARNGDVIVLTRDRCEIDDHVPVAVIEADGDGMPLSEPRQAR